MKLWIAREGSVKPSTKGRVVSNGNGRIERERERKSERD